MGCVTDRMGDGSYLTGKAELVEEFPTWAKNLHTWNKVTYAGWNFHKKRIRLAAEFTPHRPSEISEKNWST